MKHQNIKKQYVPHRHSDNSAMINEDPVAHHSLFINGNKKYIENNYYSNNVNPAI